MRRRVSDLDGSAQRVLSTAAVVGSRFDPEVIGEMIGLASEQVADAVRAGLDADLLVPDETRGWVRFAHTIVGDALAAEWNAADRARIRAAAARTIARRYPGDDHAAEVATHAAAGAADDPAFAAVAAKRAARVAAAHGAYSEAARHWAIAAEMIERSDPDDLRGRLDALVSLASACERADEMREARGAVVTATDLALGLGDWQSVGAAAGALNHASIWPNQPYPAVDHELVALLETALDAMPTDDRPERVLTLGALGTELMHTADGARRDKVSLEAVDAARRLGDPALLAKALHARTFSLKQPESVPERKQVAVEIAALADEHGLGPDVALLGELQIALADLALGDINAVAARLPTCIALLDHPVGLALRSQVGYFRALVEVIRGRYGEAVGARRRGARAVPEDATGRGRGVRVRTAAHDRPRPRRAAGRRPARTHDRRRDRVRTRTAALQRHLAVRSRSA